MESPELPPIKTVYVLIMLVYSVSSVLLILCLFRIVLARRSTLESTITMEYSDSHHSVEYHFTPYPIDSTEEDDAASDATDHDIDTPFISKPVCVAFAHSESQYCRASLVDYLEQSIESVTDRVDKWTRTDPVYDRLLIRDSERDRLDTVDI
jgi:hypothetical protein